VYNKTAAAGYDDLGHAYQVMGQPEAALRCHRESLHILEKMAAADPGNRDLSRAAAIAANGVGSTLVDLKDGAAAIPYLKRSLASLAAIPDQTSIIVPYLRAMVEYHLGRAYLVLGQRADARAALERSVPVFQDFTKRGIAIGEEAALAEKAAGTLAKLK
jgi:tetratricopeptide (TPR) repeat protein